MDDSERAMLERLVREVGALRGAVQAMADQQAVQIREARARDSQPTVSEPAVRPYDYVHTCTCSGGWVIDPVSGDARPCQRCRTPTDTAGRPAPPVDPPAGPDTVLVRGSDIRKRIDHELRLADARAAQKRAHRRVGLPDPDVLAPVRAPAPRELMPAPSTTPDPPAGRRGPLRGSARAPHDRRQGGAGECPETASAERRESVT